MTDQNTEPDGQNQDPPDPPDPDNDPHDRLRVGGWVPSRNDSTATHLMPTVPAPADGSLELPSFLQPREIGPLMPVRVPRRRGRWWFVVVPLAIGVLAGAVALQVVPGGDRAEPGVPQLSPVVALPEAGSRSARANEPSASPSVSATPSTSSAAPRQAASPAGSARPTSTTATTAPAAHPGAVVGVGGRCLAADRRDRPELAVCEDRNSQRWSAPADGTVRVLNRCLDVFASGEANGTPVILYPCNRSDAQQWQRRGDGTWRNPQSNKCLSTVGGRSDPGTRLAVFDCSGAAHQKWTLS